MQSLPLKFKSFQTPPWTFPLRQSGSTTFRMCWASIDYLLPSYVAFFLLKVFGHDWGPIASATGADVSALQPFSRT